MAAFILIRTGKKPKLRPHLQLQDPVTVLAVEGKAGGSESVT